MPNHYEKKTLSYSPAQIFDLVADIESYPDFLPWCKEAVILNRDDKKLVADLVVGSRLFSDRFCSHVILDKPHSITVTYGGGALQHLSTVWTFNPASHGACEVSFFVDFEIKSLTLGFLMDAFFDKAFCRMVNAFEDRAALLYGNL